MKLKIVHKTRHQESIFRYSPDLARSSSFGVAPDLSSSGPDLSRSGLKLEQTWTDLDRKNLNPKVNTSNSKLLEIYRPKVNTSHLASYKN